MLPKINQTLFLQVFSEFHDPDANPPATLRTRVADMDARSLYIEVPLDEKTRRLHRCQVGDPFQVFFFTGDGIKLQFQTSVIGHRKDGIQLVALRKPETDEISSEMRRSYLRVEAHLELAVQTEEKLRFVAVTDDVGGGGLSFTCERKWPIESSKVLTCWLLMNYKSGTIAHSKFEGEVVRVLPVEPDRNLVMMRFQEIAEPDQQKIIRFCFEKQLDKRKE